MYTTMRDTTKVARRGSSALTILSAIALTVLLGTAPVGAEPAQRTTSAVSWHPQSGSGTVASAQADLVTTDTTVDYRFRATQLKPKHAYTLWVVIINDPAKCAEPFECTGQDVLFATDTVRAEVVYGAGQVAGDAGRGTFAGSLRAGDVAGGWFGHGLEDPRSAQFHLVVNDHGPKIPSLMPSMIQSYRGGCTDESLPPPFPETATSDGEPGPNTCRLYQVAAAFE